MNSTKDISVSLPVELLEYLSKVIKVGLQRSNIPAEARKSITYWWEAEYDLIKSEIQINICS